MADKPRIIAIQTVDLPERVRIDFERVTRASMEHTMKMHPEKGYAPGGLNWEAMFAKNTLSDVGYEDPLIQSMWMGWKSAWANYVMANDPAYWELQS